MKVFFKTSINNQETSSFCQLQNFVRSFLVLMLLMSCASKKNDVDNKSTEKVDNFKPEAHLFPYSARWFKIPGRFTLKDDKDSDYFHPFFDIVPTDNNSTDYSLLNFFITTPEQSLFRYNLDLYSGSLYKEGDYCKSRDIWDSYSSELNRPAFTQGIVPRTYDQNQNPQRIIVFSRYPSISYPFSSNPTYYLKSRLVGSILLNQCQSYPCDSSSWVPTQVLVGVDPFDDYYKSVKTLADLRPLVDWPYVKALLNNQEGVHQVGERFFPAYRITKEFSLENTLKHFLANMKKVNVEELALWREKCFKIYDDIWDKVNRIRKDESDQQELFLILFKTFYAKSGKEFYQCQRLVRPGTVNDDPNRMWFFSFLQAFSNLENNGFYYSCRDGAWGYNPKIDEQHYANDQFKEIGLCKPKEFEKMFDSAINGMGLMRNQLNKTFRFVEYDHQTGGSHQKIYSWILFQNKATNCTEKKLVSKLLQFETFPQDVVWPSFKSLTTDSRLIK